MVLDSRGGLRKVEPGNLLIVTPHQLHGYGGDELPFCEDTVCFTGTVADHLHRSGVLQPGVFSLGPARRLLPIIDLAMDPDVHSQIRANIALQNLIVEIHLNDRKETASERYAGIRSLQEEIRRHPGKWWSVVEMAEYCNLSVVQFRRVFRRVTGMAPKEYVDRYKVRLAADRLYGPAESIGSIARELGYRDPFHFSRRFKQITGCSPEQYRKNRFR